MNTNLNIGTFSAKKLKETYEIIQIWQSTSAISTTLEVPKSGGGTVSSTKYQINLDGYEGGIDAIALKMSGGYPIDEVAETSTGDIVTCTLSGADNRTCTLSATPSAYPVAIVFEILIQAQYVNEIDSDYIVERFPVLNSWDKGGNTLVNIEYIGSLNAFPVQTGANSLVHLEFQTINAIKYLSGQYWYPSADSTTAFQLCRANGSTIDFNYDSTNGRIGIGTTTPSYKLQVSDGTNAILSVDTVNSRLKVGKSITTAPSKTLDLAGNFRFETVSEPNTSEMTATLAGQGAGNLNNGVYSYGLVYVTAEGETGGEIYYTTQVTVIDKTVDGKVLVSNIPVPTDPRVISKKLYRSVVNGGIYFLYPIATLSVDATTYIDNNPDTTSGKVFYRKANTTAGHIYLNSNLIMSAPDLYHTSLGRGAGQSNTSGNSWVFIGGLAGFSNTTGNSSVFVGYAAGATNTSGGNNIGIGYSSLSGQTTGSGNVAIGADSMRNDSGTVVNNNVAIGDGALVNIYTGSNYNVSIGRYSGVSSGYTGASIGNTFIGSRTGTMTLTNGSYNILIGHNVDVPAAATSNFLNIGNVIYATGLGISGATPSSTGMVGIGINNPASKLHLDFGNATAGGIQLTNGTTTGQTSADGFHVGLDTNGNAIINQKENLYLALYTNNTERLRYLAGGGTSERTGTYKYLDASPTADTVNDIRISNQSGTFTVEKCTVANATKGAGTWVTILTA